MNFDREMSKEEVQLIKDYVALKSKHELLQHEVEQQRHELFHAHAYEETFHNWIKSDSVNYALRYAFKNPSKTGIDEFEDKTYIEVYRLSNKLRELDKQDVEKRNDSFEQQLP